MDEYELDFGDDYGDYEPNRRGRGKRKAKRRGKWSRKSRRTSKRRSRRSSKSRWSRKSKRTSRKTRSSRGRWGRKARRSSKRKSRRSWGRKTRRTSKRRGKWSRKSRRTSKRRGSRRGYRRNGYMANLFGGTRKGPTAAGAAYGAEFRKMKAGLGAMSPADRAVAIQALKARHMKGTHSRPGMVGEYAKLRQRQAMMQHPSMQYPWGSPIYAPWARPKAPKPPKPKFPPGTQDLLFKGYTPKHLFAAMKAMTADQVRALFPTYGAYNAFMRQMSRDSRFRRYKSRWAKSSRFYKGKKRGRWGKRRGKWGKKSRWSKRRGRGRGRRNRWSKRRSYRGRRRNRWSKRRSYRGRRRGSYRRNSSMLANLYTQNMPFADTKELAISGLCAILGYVGPQAAGIALGKFVHPIAGVIGGLLTGAAAVYASDKLFSETDSYAKGFSIGGILGVIASAAHGAIMLYQGMKAPAAAAGFGVSPVSTSARYVLNPFGQFQQAAAGQFQQAAAGFQQAAAGFGEYVQGTGEYVSNDGSMQAVSDFGEYVSSGINVEGYSDYEVMPQYSQGADGLGYVNEGVHPGSNMDNEFNIMEAAAGLSGSSRMASDYIPTVGASYVGNQGSSPDAGIFDIGGPNGVFG